MIKPVLIYRESNLILRLASQTGRKDWNLAQQIFEVWMALYAKETDYCYLNKLYFVISNYSYNIVQLITLDS
jgi:hypothetical protein